MIYSLIVYKSHFVYYVTFYLYVNWLLIHLLHVSIIARFTARFTARFIARFTARFTADDGTGGTTGFGLPQPLHHFAQSFGTLVINGNGLKWWLILLANLVGNANFSYSICLYSKSNTLRERRNTLTIMTIIKLSSYDDNTILKLLFESWQISLFHYYVIFYYLLTFKHDIKVTYTLTTNLRFRVRFVRHIQYCISISEHF